MNRKIRIVLTGGGTGGHVFPLVAVAEEIIKLERENAIVSYLGPKHPLNEELEKRRIRVYKIASSKWRRYVSFANLLDVPKFFWGFFQALFHLYFLMPDVLFSKGGTSALPVIFAARFYLIPVVIHESDSIPGLTNRISGRLAKKVFLSFESAGGYFPKSKTEIAGNPVRSGLLLSRLPDIETARSRLKFKASEPLVVVLTGSQGATRINSFIFENLESFLKLTQIFHQVGEPNLQKAAEYAKFQNRYQCVGLIGVEEMKTALTAADIVISRAGSGAIFEIASFSKPSILIPLKEAASDHQRVNAYEYARGGAAIVIEENNLSFNLVKTQFEKILQSPKVKDQMSAAANAFAKPGSAEIIAKKLIELIKR